MADQKFKWVLVRVPINPPTVNEMAEQLRQGRRVLCRNGARARLTGLLKREGVFTKHRRVARGYLFEPCQPRAWK
jgi:hypothetical protein